MAGFGTTKLCHVMPRYSMVRSLTWTEGALSAPLGCTSPQCPRSLLRRDIDCHHPEASTNHAKPPGGDSNPPNADRNWQAPFRCTLAVPQSGKAVPHFSRIGAKFFSAPYFARPNLAHIKSPSPPQYPCLYAHSFTGALGGGAERLRTPRGGDMFPDTHHMYCLQTDHICCCLSDSLTTSDCLTRRSGT